MAEETKLEKLQRMGLAPGGTTMFDGGRMVIQHGGTLEHLATVAEQEVEELHQLREKRRNSPGHLLSGSEVDRLAWLERWHGGE